MKARRRRRCGRLPSPARGLRPRSCLAWRRPAFVVRGGDPWRERRAEERARAVANFSPNVVDELATRTRGATPRERRWRCSSRPVGFTRMCGRRGEESRGAAREVHDGSALSPSHAGRSTRRRRRGWRPSARRDPAGAPRPMRSLRARDRRDVAGWTEPRRAGRAAVGARRRAPLARGSRRHRQRAAARVRGDRRHDQRRGKDRGADRVGSP